MKFNISKDEPVIDHKIIDPPTSWYHLDFEVKKPATPFLSIGTGFEFPVQKHKLQTFISYTIFSGQEYKLNNYANYYDLINGPVNCSTNAFSQNNLEVGITFFW